MFLKQRVSKDMKHASISIEHHRALMGEEETSQAKIEIGGTAFGRRSVVTCLVNQYLFLVLELL